MRLDSIDLIRFGHFYGRKIELPLSKPDYHLIYGDNEAGKSTLLRAISALLFEIPVNTPDVHSCKGPELRIGGTISDGANRFTFRRRKGTTGTLLDTNEEQIAEDALAPFLRELDQERFEQLFGLNHERLRQGGAELLRGHGDVGSALFQAAGFLELRHLQAKLDAEAREIFSPKSRSRVVGRILNDYRQARAEINRLSISGALVKQKQSELEAAKAALARLKEQSHALQQELVRLRRIEGNKPDLAHLHQVRTELAAVADIPDLPEDARRHFDEAANTLANANGQISTLRRDIAQRELRIQELPTDALLTARETEIEDLNAASGAYIQSVKDRTKRRREREDALELAQEAWTEIWSQPITEAEKLKAAYSGKEEILNLGGKHNGLTADLTNAEEELANLTLDQQRLQQELAEHPEVSDPDALLAAIEQARSLGDTDQMSARLRSEAERLARNAQRHMKNLVQWPGTMQELELLRTPLVATVDEYAREWLSITDGLKALSMRHESALDAVRQKERELADLSSRAAEASQSELAGARARRDELWLSIRGSRKAITGPQADSFAEHLRKADEIADLRFTNATEVAIHDRLIKEIEAARAAQQMLAKEIERLERARRELQQRWKSEWTGLNAPALSPSEMKEWMQARDGILSQYEQSREKKAELQSLEDQALSAATQIAAKWKALDPSTAPAAEPLPVLIRMAETFARQRERQRRTREGIHRQLKPQSMDRRRARLDQCRRSLAQWSEKWSGYIATLWLDPNTTPDQMNRALSVLEKVFDHLKDADRLQYRIKRIGDNVDLFEARAGRLAAELDPSCSSLTAETSVRQFHERLLALRDAETERKALHAQNQKDKAALAAADDNARNATAVLEQLKGLANCNDGKDGDDRQLDQIIAAAERKADLQHEEKRISGSLRERNASVDMAHIEEEASAYALDSLRSDIAAKTTRSQELVDEISQAAAHQGQLFNEFETLENSEQAALQAQKAEDALAELRPAVGQYLRLRLAAEVLQQAIESYRQKHQGPILTRASELFSRLTLGRHSGLTNDFGSDDKPVLVAIRAGGELVHVEGLSDGACDQLYLALRIAAIEHHVTTVAPCPVIFDDLLINSDDARAAAALQVISELAKSTQVLFFTHHKRLADLAIRAGAQPFELGAVAAAVV